MTFCSVISDSRNKSESKQTQTPCVIVSLQVHPPLVPRRWGQELGHPATAVCEGPYVYLFSRVDSRALPLCLLNGVCFLLVYLFLLSKAAPHRVASGGR